MANKTKKRIVTGLACTLPAVVAVPTLLTLAQCGNPTSTDHFELTGDVKKESTFATYQNKVVYQFTLKNVKDTRNIHVNLKNFKINGNDVKDEEKALMYNVETSTSGILKITLKVDKIKAFTQSNDASTQYEVRFDINLSSSEFNDTLTGFKIDLIYPEFDVVKTGTHMTITGDDKVVYNPSATDYYEYKLTADAHYQFNKEKVAVYRDGKELVKDTDYTIDTDTQTINLYKKAITGKIEIKAEADAIQYTITTTGVAAEANVFKNVPSQCPYGQDIDVDLVWTDTKVIGKNLDLDSISSSKFTVTVTEDGVGTTDITSKCSINNFHLTIPGNLITGQVTISSGLVDVKDGTTIIVSRDNATVTSTTTENEGKAWADQTFSYALGNNTEEAKVKQSYQIKDVVATLTKYNSASEVVSTRELHANELEVNRSSTLTDDGRPQGTIKIPASKYDGGDIKFEVIAEKTTFVTSNYAKDSHIQFTNASDSGVFNKDLEVTFEIEDGYIFDASQFNVLRTVEGKVDNITNACMPTVVEGLTEIKIPAAQLQTRSGTLTINAGTKLIERKVTYGTNGTTTGIADGSRPEEANIEKDLVADIAPAPGYGAVAGLTVTVGGTALAAEDFTYDGKVLTVPKEKITGAVAVDWTKQTANSNNVTYQNKSYKVNPKVFQSWAKFDEAYTSTFTAAANYELPNAVKSITMGNAILDPSKYTWSVVDGVGTLSIPKDVVTDDLDIEIIATPINYDVTYTNQKIGSTSKEWLIWDENNKTQLNIDGEYDIYFDVIAGAELDETAFTVTTNSVAMERGEQKDYTLTIGNGHDGNTRYHLHINKGAVKGAVAFTNVKMAGGETEKYNVSFVVSGETEAESIASKTIGSYSYYSDYGASVTLNTGFKLDDETVKVTDAKGNAIPITLTGPSGSTYNIAIKQADTVASNITITVSPIRETYDITSTYTSDVGTGFELVLPASKKASYKKEVVIGIKNLHDSQEIVDSSVTTGNLTVTVGGTQLTKDKYTITSESITIPEENVTGAIVLSGKTTTKQFDITTTGSENVTFPKLPSKQQYGKIIEGTFKCDDGKTFKSANVQIKVGDNWVDADPSLWSITNLGEIQILPGLVKQDINIIVTAA